MCTVGTYGLRGWKTSETPIASHGRPAISGRCAVAEGGSLVPVTCEKPTPARSSNCAALEDARDAAAAFGALPFVAARTSRRRAPRMRSTMRFAAAPAGIRERRAVAWRAIIAAVERAVADVAAELHAVEADLLDHLVGALGGDLHLVAERGDAQHAPAAGDRPCRRASRCRRGRRARRPRPWASARDLVALARPSG